ncbi:MAG TPA: ATP-binding cassette domain-containing protein [bacterium]|nr:ATP-binding cassette domain-containing protein [bacterium]
MLEVLHLKKHFSIKSSALFERSVPVYAVNDVNLTINRGETLSLVGESGSGKTTTGRCILRLIESTSGEITFDGQNIFKLSHSGLRKLRREMQIIFQDPFGSLTPRIKICDLLREPLDIHKIGTKAERKNMVASIMEKVGLRPEHMNRYAHEFSGGQRQRICIARAIIVKPKLIVADEPVSALDVSIRAQILNLLAELQEEFNLSYLLIAHDLSVVKYMSDRVAVMYLGKIIELASRDDLYANFQHPYTEALLSAIPIPSMHHRKQRIVLEGDIPSPITPPSGCRFHPRCIYRREKCRKIEPEFKDLGQGHFVSCHFR